MIPFDLLVAVALAYVIFLFLIAFWAEKQAAAGKGGWLRAPLVYTLSLSVYCTAWTFYGAVGYAARSGLEFVTIYLGPTLVLIGWWVILRKLVQIGRVHRITSIADLISSRFGKSNTLGVIVTLMAVIGTTPYIALQLQSVILSFGVFAADSDMGWSPPDEQSTALWVAAGLAVFTILFGTRNLDANERHDGVVMAIAVEAVVKLFALIAVGVFVVWGIAGGPGQMMARIDSSAMAEWQMDRGRWVSLTFLAAAAFLCLPRMFQVMVVENESQRNLAVASWAFPLYMLAVSLFVVPIAVVGLDLLPAGSNPDLFVLTVPLAEERGGLALLAFLGGLSSATSMVIVAAIALSTMVSNHILMPLWLRARPQGTELSGDVRPLVLMARRFSIVGVLGLGYAYYELSGGGSALAAMGLISFVGVAQFLPALVGGIFWRGATRAGALAGLSAGFAIWVYSLFLPSVGTVLPETWLESGPLGLIILRPQALFGIEGMDPLVHAVFWSILLNSAAFVCVSLLTFPSPVERLQGAQFVNVFEHSESPRSWTRGTAEAEDLLIMAQRILGASAAQRLFQAQAKAQGHGGYLPDITPKFMDVLERELAGSVGSATAHAMIGQIVAGASVSVGDLMAVADETAQMMEYSSQLEAKSAELGRAARQLRQANEKLTALSVQKDAFLSQISHELRTPMTSIRAFSEILRDDALDGDSARRYADIIHGEALRLTRLLDDLLDLSVLENGQVSLNTQSGRLGDVLDRAVAATSSLPGALSIHRERGSEAIMIETDLDRLAQVFINLIANARKYCAAATPRLHIKVGMQSDRVTVDFVDNGAGIPARDRAVIFEKFARLANDGGTQGAGLGLAICQEIMERLGGRIEYLPGQGGAAFRITLPERAALAAE